MSQTQVDLILDGSVGTSDLADSSVTTAKLADANVTTAKIADGAVTKGKLDSSITFSAPFTTIGFFIPI
jgi:hypothetical protein